VEDTWTEIVPCAPTSFEVSSNATTCIGSTLWTGTWTGVTTYTFDGEIDLITGAGHGTLDETFVGQDDTGRSGTLHLDETVVLVPTGVPDTAAISIDMTITGGTDDFAGARGHAVAVGIANLATGGGTFSGRWTCGR
jgi:hypothetical protein